METEAGKHLFRVYTAVVGRNRPLTWVFLFEFLVTLSSTANCHMIDQGLATHLRWVLKLYIKELMAGTILSRNKNDVL